MNSYAAHVMNDLVTNNYCSCISPRCWATFRKCMTPIECRFSDQRRLTSQTGVIDMATLSAISIDHSVYDIIGLLRHEVCDVFAFDLSDPDTVVSSLVNCTMIEVAVFRLLQSKGIATKLLKDALIEPALFEFVPAVLVEICRYLFLPSGINLRNLLWHGFALPEDLGEFVFFLSIIASLRITFDDILVKCNVSPKQYNSLARPHYMDFRVEAASIMDCEQTATAFRGSLFVIPGREGVLDSALLDFREERYASFCLKVLPCLEHGLRFIFCLVNNLPQYVLADEHSYYSTLDGFGQKSKHQLLLHPLLHVDSICCAESGLGHGQGLVNFLPRILGKGAYALLLDMFFTEAGFNLRGKFAHGEIDMSGDLRSRTHSEFTYLQEISSALLVLLVALCIKFKRSASLSQSAIEQFTIGVPCGGVDCSISPYSGVALWPFLLAHDVPDLATERCSEAQRLVMARVDDYESLYHPHKILEKEFHRARESLLALSGSMRARRDICITGARGSSAASSECEVRFEVVYGGSEVVCDGRAGPNRETVGVWEKRNRIMSIVSSKELLLVQQIPVFEEADLLKHAAAVSDNSMHSLAASIIHICVGYVETIRQMAESLCAKSLNNVRSSFLGIRQAFLCSMRKFLLPESVTGTEDFAIAINALEVGFQEFMRTVLHIYSPTLLPGVACCGQLCNVVADVCRDTITSLQEKEEIVISGRAHTSDRRQYVTLVVNTGPVVLAISAVAVSLLLLHTLIPCVRAGTEDSVHKTTPPSSLSAISSMSAMISSFSLCVPVGGQRSAGVEKKSVDKSLAQLKSSLMSKQMRKSIQCLAGRSV